MSALAAKGRKQRCWLFKLPNPPIAVTVSNKQLEEAFRGRYTTVVTVGVVSDQAAAAAGPVGPGVVLVRVLFKGPQPSEGPASLLRELYRTQNVDAIPVELPRGRRSKRARTGSDENGGAAPHGNGGGAGSADVTSDSDTSEYDDAMNPAASGAVALLEETKEEAPEDAEEDDDDGAGYQQQQHVAEEAYGYNNHHHHHTNGTASSGAQNVPIERGGSFADGGVSPPRLPELAGGASSLDMGAFSAIIKEELGEDLELSSGSSRHASPRRARRWEKSNSGGSGEAANEDISAPLPPLSSVVALGRSAAGADAAGVGFGATEALEPPHVRCEPRVCSFKGLPAVEGEGRLHFRGLPHALTALSGRSVLVRFAVDGQHFADRHSAGVRVTGEGLAWAPLEYPSMEELWPELFGTENVRVVLVDLEVHLSGEMAPNDQFALRGGDLQVAYRRPHHDSSMMGEDVAVAALDSLQRGGNGGWGRPPAYNPGGAGGGGASASGWRAVKGSGGGGGGSGGGTIAEGMIVDDELVADHGCCQYTCNDMILDWCGNFFGSHGSYQAVQNEPTA